MSYSVVILSKNADNLIPCVEAIRAAGEQCPIIVVDDGLNIEPILGRVWGNCIIVRGEKPFIFSRNANRGIAHSETDDVILLNDDALLETHEGFSVLAQACEKHPEYGLISATTNLAGNPQQRPHGIGLRDAQRVVAFVCVYIPRRTIESVGLLDERFVAYGWEDNDYCRRVRDAGLKIGIHDGCYVDHGCLHSTFRGNPRAAGNIHAGAAIYRAKWGDLN